MKKVILCVDDENIVLESLKAELTQELSSEFRIETADEAGKALEIIDELQQSDLSALVVVADWLMPGMKGDEFLIRVHEKHKNIVKIILTGHADDGSVENAFRNADLYKCLSKPYDKNELVQSILDGVNNLEKSIKLSNNKS